MIVDEFIRIAERLANVASWLRREVPDVLIEVRSSPSSRHSLANVGFRGV
jgi:hypothetical protein